MSDAVQMPPTLPVVPRVAPVRAAEHIEPPKKSQTDSQSSNQQRQESDAGSQAVASDQRQMRISRDEAARRFVYRSVVSDTGEVVWQYPAEEMLRRAHYLRKVEEQVRHTVDEKA
jgi:uncharacterized FlaG/YvyC family protein